MGYNYDDLLDSLEAISDSISSGDGSEHFAKLRHSADFFQLENSLEDFKLSLSDAVQGAQAAVRSPVYVGVVGHYSHGKSSLLNAMLFPPKSNEVLPTGESIVTSLCSLLQFRSRGDRHRYYEVMFSGDEIEIDDEVEYQRKVKGQVPGALKDVRNFRLELAVEKLESVAFAEMAQRRIELLDTPGLGGPYWNDSAALQRWVKEFMLLIVCVKADDINEATAEVVNPFLKQTTRPIIPVVTFWDNWDKAKAYKDISEERMARSKAKADLRKFFPAIEDTVDAYTVFVSARNCREGVEVPKEHQAFFSERWNVDSVCQILGSFIADRSDILASSRKEESALDRGRREQVLKKCGELKSKFDHMQAMLDGRIEKARPKQKHDEIIEEVCSKLKQDLDRTVERVATQVSEMVTEQVNAVSASGSFTEQFKSIATGIQEKYESSYQPSIVSQLKRAVERNITGKLKRFIDDESTLDRGKKNRLTRDIEQVCQDVMDVVSVPEPVKIFSDPTSNLAEQAFGLILRFLMRKKRIQECQQLKQKGRQQNTQKAIQDRLRPQFDGRDVVEALKSLLRERFDEYLVDSRENADNALIGLQDMLGDVSDKLRELDRQCIAIRRAGASS